MATLKTQYQNWIKNNPNIRLSYEIWLRTVFASKFKNLSTKKESTNAIN